MLFVRVYANIWIDMTRLRWQNQTKFFRLRNMTPICFCWNHDAKVFWKLYFTTSYLCYRHKKRGKGWNVYKASFFRTLHLMYTQSKRHLLVHWHLQQQRSFEKLFLVLDIEKASKIGFVHTIWVNHLNDQVDVVPICQTNAKTSKVKLSWELFIQYILIVHVLYLKT